MKIFISYRRADAQMTARAMKTFLDGIPAVSEVFLDFDEIAVGSDFEQVINSALAKSQVCLVLIGDKYLNGGQDGDTPRIFDPEDFVRREAALALSSKTKVVPVLIDDAEMPSAAKLPDDLKGLPRLNAFQLRTSHFNGDMDDLLDVLFGKAKGSGGRWKRPRLTVMGGITRAVAGAFFAAALVIALAVASDLHGQATGVCGSLACRMRDVMGLERQSDAVGAVLATVAAIVALGALLPFLWRWMRR